MGIGQNRGTDPQRCGLPVGFPLNPPQKGYPARVCNYPHGDPARDCSHFSSRLALRRSLGAAHSQNGAQQRERARCAGRNTTFGRGFSCATACETRSRLWRFWHAAMPLCLLRNLNGAASGPYLLQTRPAARNVASKLPLCQLFGTRSAKEASGRLDLNSIHREITAFSRQSAQALLSQLGAEILNKKLAIRRSLTKPNCPRVVLLLKSTRFTCFPESKAACGTVGLAFQVLPFSGRCRLSC